MMKYINLYQPQLIEYWLWFSEWIILDYILKANNWANKIDRDWKTFFQINTWKLLTDLPALWIKTSKWVLDKIKILTNSWLLERYSALSPYYAPTEKTRDYYFTWPNQNVTSTLPNGEVNLTKWLDNSNINYSNINRVYISVDQIKEKNKSLVAELEQLILSLRGKTDLEDVSLDDLIILRNWLYDEYKLPRINNNPNSVLIKQLARLWIKFRKEYSKEDFNAWLTNYLKEIKWRKQDWKANSYYNHRFTLPVFLSQRNWILKFMAQW